MNGLESLYQQIMVDHVKQPCRRGLGGGERAAGGRERAQGGRGRGQGERGRGAEEVAERTVCSHQVNPTCGDEVSVRIWLEGDRVRDVRWVGEGCMVSQASASIMAQQLSGLDVSEVRERIASFRTSMHSRGSVPVDEELLGDAVALEGAAKFVARVKCAMLAWVALEEALRQAQQKRTG